MARPLRIERAGAWYHVTARGNERRAIFRDDRDRRHFCQLLGETADAFAWNVHAYVLMDNHFHTLIETAEPNLARGMHWLNVSYSVWFNRRHDRSGHLFQGRYKAIIFEPDSWGLELSRYVHLNPVRTASFGLDKSARLADRVAPTAPPDSAQIHARTDALRSYLWSSYRAYVGLDSPPDWLTSEALLRKCANPESSAAETYRRFVESALRQGLPESPWEKLTAQTALGGARFLRGIKQALTGNAREQTAARRLRAKTAMPQIIETVEKIKGEKWAAFRDRHGDWGRDLALYLGRKQHGLALKVLGHAAGGVDYMSVSIAIHRFARRLEKDRELRAALDRCQTALAR